MTERFRLGAAEVKGPAGQVGPRACGGSHGGQGGTQPVRALLVGYLSQSGKLFHVCKGMCRSHGNVQWHLSKDLHCTQLSPGRRK